MAGGFAVARLNVDGSPDEAFGSGGQVITLFAQPESGPLCSATDVEVLTDGRIFAGGYRGGPSDGRVASVRYNADGTLDAAYGDGGILYTSDLYADAGITWPGGDDCGAPPPTGPAPAEPTLSEEESAVAVAVPRAVARTRVVQRGAFFKFNVTYASDSGAAIDLASLGNGNLSVTGPGEFTAPTELVRAKARRNGTLVKAT